MIVTSPPLAYYSAAFTLTLDRPLDSFSRPSAQRAFVEHLAKLFGDRDASHIVGIGFEEAPAQGTRVRWANATLANNVECPESTIGQLREVSCHCKPFENYVRGVIPQISILLSRLEIGNFEKMLNHVLNPVFSWR